MSDLPTGEPARLQEGLGSGLHRKLAAVGRKLVRVEVIRRLAIALSVTVVALVLVLAVDWLADLSMDVRGAILAGLATLGGLLLCHAVAAFFTQRRDEESLALMVEHDQPDFRSRLIASVQFVRGKATIPDQGAQAMVERLVQDTESYAAPLALTEAVKTGPLKRALLVLFLLGALAVAGYLAGGGITRDLLKRAFLTDVPVPRATRVVWTSGDFKTGIGDTVTIEAQADGYEPERGTLRTRYASGRKQIVPMEAMENSPGGYAATIENVQESFTYVAAIHDGRSERKAVRALPRPRVMELTGRQSYPDYTNLPPSDHQPGEFLLFPGSRLELIITSSQPLKKGSVRLLGRDGIVDSEVDGVDPRILHARFTAPDEDLTGFTVELLDAEEMASRDGIVYRVEILSDEPPRVRIAKPSRRRELATPQARVLLAYEAEDRFGIERVALHYAVLVDEKPGVIHQIDLPIAETGAKKVTESFDWDLGDIELLVAVGDEIQFWIEAYDQNADTAAGKSATRILKVVTAREKRDDLLSRVGDSLGRVDQATDDQERLNAVLAEWIRAQAPLSSEPHSQNDNQNGKEN